MEFEFIHNDISFHISLDKNGKCYKAVLNENEYTVDCCPVSKHCYSFIINGQSYLVYVANSDNRIYVRIGCETYCFSMPGCDDDEQIISCSDSRDGAKSIKAPMPGNVLKILVTEGEKISEGQCLVIVEAMKMETELCAKIDGTVRKIHVKAETQINAGDVLIELEDDDSTGCF